MHWSLIKRVGVALSGGVDSSVAALLLKRQGYDVHGIFMKNWDEREERGVCPSETDYRDVQWVCQQIGIPCYQVDFVRHYWNEVFSEFLHGYDQGITPNPDVLCNERIKFGAFHRYIIDTLGMDAMATGHYAQLEPLDNGTVKLLRSIDTFKDQTYFLSTISQAALQHVMFPIGHLNKSQVRSIACQNGLHRIAAKKESMGLCFIGKRKFSEFLSEYLECTAGDVMTLADGKTIGKHNGYQYYTIGQRVCVNGQKEPLYVVKKDPLENKLTAVFGADHSALYCTQFTTDTPSWIRRSYKGTCDFEARVRHQGNLVLCRVEEIGCGLRVSSSVPLRAVAPGQHVVFYKGEECVGGARVKEVMAEQLVETNGDSKESTASPSFPSSSSKRDQTIFVMRHGARLDTADPKWELKTDRPYDTPITGKGKVEAYDIARKRYHGKNITKVISSPFLRCLQTSHEVCRVTGVKGVVTRNSLSEIMTRGAKMKSAPLVPAENIGEYDFSIVEFDSRPIPPYPETLQQSLERYKIAFQEIADEYYPDNIVLVTHQYGVEQALHMGLDKTHPLSYEVVYCGNVELTRSEKDDKWKVVSKSGIYRYDNMVI